MLGVSMNTTYTELKGEVAEYLESIESLTDDRVVGRFNELAAKFAELKGATLSQHHEVMMMLTVASKNILDRELNR